jgi:hypothetical protein
MSATITGTIIQGTQNIENNSTEVTVVLTVSWNGGSWAGDNPPGSITIDGETKTFTKNFNTSQKNSGSEELYRWTKTVYHNDDGTKTVECSGYSQVNRKGEGSSYYAYWDGSKVLTTIARADTLGEIEDFNIHDKITIPFTKVSQATTSTLSVKYGSTEIYSCPHTEIKNGLPDSAKLAFYKAVGNTVMSGEVTFLLTTYYNGTAIGNSVQTAIVSRNKYDELGNLSAFDIEKNLNVLVTKNRHSTMTNKLLVKHGDLVLAELVNVSGRNLITFGNKPVLKMYNALSGTSGAVTVSLETFYQGYSVGKVSKNVTVNIGGTAHYNSGVYTKALVWFKANGKWVKCLMHIKDGKWRRGR